MTQGEGPPVFGSPMSTDVLPASRPQGNRRAMFGVLGLVVLILVAAVVVVLTMHHHKDNSTSAPASWDPKILPIVHFVEHERGLKFKHPVKVDYLSDKAFNRKVTAPSPTSKSDRAELQRAVEELRALGLIRKSVNLVDAENKLTQSDVVGLYDPDTKQLYVRGTTLNTLTRVTVSHELTHALQDQYFDLNKLEKRAPAGAADPLRALVEGDAVRVNQAYERTLPSREQKKFEADSAKAQKASDKATTDVPEVLSNELEFPYTFGPAFIDSLVNTGGTRAIDNAFRNPPVSEAQVADPVHYALSKKPASVARPALPKGARTTDKPMSFGQVSLFEVFGSRLGYKPAWHAVQGWTGDNSITYRSGSRTCVAIDVRMSTPARTTDLFATAKLWAAHLPATAVASHGGLVQIRSCDPGKAAPALPKIKPSAFEVLSTRAQLIDAFMTDGHIDFTTGGCVADHVITGLGDKDFALIQSDAPSASQVARLRGLVQAGIAAC